MTDTALIFNILAKDNATGTFNKFHAAAGAALAGVALAAGGLAIASIKAGSDLAETQNFVQQVFGDSSKAINAFGDTAAEKLVMSKNNALDAAATFGIFGKSAGLSGGELTGFSTKLVGLAADLASIKNTTPEQAIEAVGAALRGESEPIRNYGVLLDDATLRQRALSMGIASSITESLTPQQKVLAANAEIMAQTTYAQGDVERSAGTLSYAQKSLTAQFADAKAELGQAMLPILLKVVSAFVDMAKWGRENQAWLVPVVAIVGGLVGLLYAASTSIKIVTAAQWLWNVAMNANPIGLIIAAIVLLVGGFYFLWTHSAGFRNFWIGMWGGVQAAFGWAVDFIKNGLVGLSLMLDWIGGIFVGFGNWVAGLWDSIWGGLSGGFMAAIDWMVGGWEWFFGFINGMGSRIGNSIANLWDSIAEGFKHAINWIIYYWNKLDLKVPQMTIFGQTVGGFDLIYDLPYLAQGGVVPAQSGGAPYMLGDGGEPEAVIPLSKMGGLGGGGVITLRLEGDGDFAEFIRKIIKAEGNGNVQLALGS